MPDPTDTSRRSFVTAAGLAAAAPASAPAAAGDETTEA